MKRSTKSPKSESKQENTATEGKRERLSDQELLRELKEVNAELISQLRKQYPDKKDQKYLGIYEEPKEKKRRIRN